MQTLDRLDKLIYEKRYGKDESLEYPVKVIQIGDGNFIRSFIDWLFSQMNAKGYFQGKVVTVQALESDQTAGKLNNQNGYYTVMLKGSLNGDLIDETHIVNSIKYGLDPYKEWGNLLRIVENEEVEYLFSNTTEAGIVYEKEKYDPNSCPYSYPAKLTALLYHRYKYFKGDLNKGWYILPCELIDKNGEKLKSICLEMASDWKLEQEFVDWIQKACVFFDTLVDRIVPGFPKSSPESYFKKLGYRDLLLSMAEPYHLFVIEGPEEIRRKLPFDQAGLNVVFDQVELYRNLKVKLLNGSHSILTLLGLLMRIENVKDSLENLYIQQFLTQVLKDEIIVAMPLEIQSKAIEYIEEMFNRFNNPFIEHKLIDISLNSFSKFQTRIWPSLVAYMEKYNTVPKRLAFIFAVQLYYLQEGIQRKTQLIREDEKVMSSFEIYCRENITKPSDVYVYIETVVSTYFNVKVEFYSKLVDQISYYYDEIVQNGLKDTMRKIESGEKNEENNLS